MGKSYSAAAQEPEEVSEPQKRLIGQLYSRYRKELCDYIAVKCNCSGAEVDDIVQTAFVRFSSLKKPDEIKNPRAFLFKTAYNIAIDNIRHSKVTEDYAYSTSQTHNAQANELDPERIAESRQRLGIIAQAMWHMPSKRRQLLMMNRFDNLSYAEIARRIGLSETVVRKHVARALVDCHKALGS